MPDIEPPAFTSTFKRVEDCHILTDVYLPESNPHDETIQKRPVLISYHGGGFLLGARQGIPQIQLQDWLGRGWIVVLPDYRLCPQVDIYEGAICDGRDLLRWVAAGDTGLDGELARHGAHFRGDLDKIIDSGSSSGGTIAHAVVFGEGMPRVAAMVDFFGAKDFQNPLWTQSVAMMPFGKCPPEQVQIMMDERPVCTNAPILDGKPDTRRRSIWQNARLQYAMNMLSSPDYFTTFLPSGDFKSIDPVLNVNEETVERWPPTWILHGLEDERVSIDLSRKLQKLLVNAGVECKLIEVPGEGHGFVGSMQEGGESFALQCKAFDEVEQLISGR